MTAMAGFSIHASIQLQPRVLSTSWVRKSGVFACLKGRVYSSSGPVRYIPKGSSNDEKSRTHLTPEIVNGNDFSSGLDVNARRIEVKHRSEVPRSNFNDTLRDQNQYEKNYSAGGSMLGIYMELFNSLKPL
ncbi:Regulatory protein recX [Cucumis melo var. makuwa]|uniref:Regulatory protein recX n=1 Tax=Cucumis melo var. makuwa TaxID=1194695 RepID=A0A5D3DHW6_CUCMM|nr:Regulatory protein recX [Cucumis melo var. makuwa]